jgi:hypothetical protein
MPPSPSVSSIHALLVVHCPFLEVDSCRTPARNSSPSCGTPPRSCASTRCARRARPAAATHHLLLGGRPHGGTVLRRDAVRPPGAAASRQRSVRAVEGTRGAAAVRGLGEAVGSSRATRSSPARARRRISRGIPRRGCRSSTSRPGRSARGSRRRRHRAQRAAHRLGLPHLRAARRRRDGGGIGLGGGAGRRRTTRLDSCARSPTSTRSGRAGRRVLQHDLEALAARWRAFGWHTVIVDGHDLAGHPRRARRGARHQGRPTMILARTIKGKGVSLIEGKDGWHGKPLKKGEELDGARGARGAARHRAAPPAADAACRHRAAGRPPPPADRAGRRSRLRPRRRGRHARGVRDGARRARRADARIVALDADVKNSTFSEKFEKAFPDRFYQMLHRRAEHGRRRDGAGGARRDPVPSTFACFLTRATTSSAWPASAT